MEVLRSIGNNLRQGVSVKVESYERALDRHRAAVDKAFQLREQALQSYIKGTMTEERSIAFRRYKDAFGNSIDSRTAEHIPQNITVNFFGKLFTIKGNYSK